MGKSSILFAVFWAKMRYYLLKVKGHANIPDYVQVRDAQFTLVCYVRPGRTDKRTLLPPGLLQELSTVFPQLPYGQVQPVEWDPDRKILTLL